MTYQSHHHVVYSCQYHGVWCPKYRRRVLVCGVDERLKGIIHQVAEEYSVEVREIEVMPDHVHLLIEVDPQYGIHRFVKPVKGRSSRLFRQEFPWLKSRLPSLWTHSYFVSTVGGGTACRHQTVHRKSKNGLDGDITTPHHLSAKSPCA